MEQLRIKATSPAQVVRSLSGGNQQKVVLAKWLAAEPRILILDEPTHGVDVGTKADVHRTISHLAAQGLTILMISSELPEILGMSDRVLVMREGRLVAELSRAEATQERVIAGGRRDRGGMIARASRTLKPQEIAAAALPPARARHRHRARRRDRLLRVRAPNFLTVGNWQDIAQGRRDRLVVAVGETMVVLTRNIDLCVGSMVGLAPISPPTSLAHHNGAPLVRRRAARGRRRPACSGWSTGSSSSSARSPRSSPRSRRWPSTAASSSAHRAATRSPLRSCPTRS